MRFSDPEVEKVREVFGNASQVTDVDNKTVLIVRQVRPIPDQEDVRDILLVSEQDSSYPSRLYFSKRIDGRYQRNWNGQRSFMEETWCAFSWNGVTVDGKSPVTLILEHLRGLMVPQ